MFGFGFGNVRWSGLRGGVSDPDFVLLVKTDNTGTSANNRFTIPTAGVGFNYTVTTSEQTLTNETGNVTLEWAVAGTYEVRISGDFPRIFFNNGGDKLKLLEVQNWGNIVWGANMSSAFFGCSNMDVTATDVPNFSGVTNMTTMLRGCTNLVYNASINNWDVSSVTTMNSLFFQCTNFNQPIGNWNVSSVTNMFVMFESCTNFNQDISNWNVSNVTTMERMFFLCVNFNGDVTTWNVSNVTNMRLMFRNCTNFNQDLSSWNVGSVTNMENMFMFCSNFNQDLSNWNVGNVTNMNSMFHTCTNFKQDISNWNVSNVSIMTNMFFAVTLSTTNYSNMLIAWAELTLQSNVSFHGGNSKYNIAGGVARQKIIDDFNWTITDGGAE